MTVAHTSELAEALAPDVLDRLLRYVRIDTQSDRAHAQSPSTPGPARAGAAAASTSCGRSGSPTRRSTTTGFVTATLPATVEGAPGDRPARARRHEPGRARARGVEPLVHRDYDGGAIALPRNGTVLDPERDARAGRQGRPRPRHHERRHAARRRRQGRRGRGDGRGRPPRRASRAAAPDDPRRLHARRGDRGGGEACSTSSASAPTARTRSTARRRASSPTRRSRPPRPTCGSTASTCIPASRPASSSTRRGSRAGSSPRCRGPS